MTNASDFAFNDTATRLNQAGEGGIRAEHPPLTKREYFAAMAMQGLLSANPVYTHGNTEMPVPDLIATHAVNYADSIIKALNDNP